MSLSSYVQFEAHPVSNIAKYELGVALFAIIRYVKRAVSSS